MRNNPKRGGLEIKEAIAMIVLGILFACASHMMLKVASLQYFSLRSENGPIEAWRNYEN